VTPTRFLLGLLLVSSLGCGPKATDTAAESPVTPRAAGIFTPDTELIARNNQGVALMGQFQYVEAAKVFEDLVREHPDWLDAQVNLAIAYVNVDQGGKRALPLLEAVLAKNPEHLAAHYCQGLMLFHAEQQAAALPHLQKVFASDPQDVYTAYLIAACLEPSSRDEALAWYEKAIAIDPNFRTPYYRCFDLLRQAKQTDKAMAALQRFQELDNSPLARMFEWKYTRMGPKAETIAAPRSEAAAPSTPVGPPFAEPTPLLTEAAPQFSVPTGPMLSVTACDINADNRVDVFVAGGSLGEAGPRNAVLLQREDGGWQLDQTHPLAVVPGVNAAAWGDFDDDGRVDVYLCRRGANQLWRQQDGGQWQDVTEAAQAAAGDHNTTDALALDADHDGDLDLLLVHSDAPFELLNNDRDGTFRPVAQEGGIVGDGRPARSALAADLDHDRDLDLIVLHDAPPHDVYLNDRAWRYRTTDLLQEFAASPVRAALAADLDLDGKTELYAVGPEGLVRWSSHPAGSWTKTVLSADVSFSADEQPRLALADIRGDGRLSLIGGGKTWRAWDLAGDAVKPIFEGAGVDLAGWALAVLDDQRGPSIVGATQQGQTLAWKPGPGRHAFVSFTLTGSKLGAKPPRTSTSGLGTRAALRVGSRWTVADYLRLESGPGQSLQPLTLGLGGAEKADFLRLIWPDGVTQAERDLTAGLHRIAEEDRMPSSCPVLFAWNGTEYAFVSDLLGVGGLGYLVAPGQYAESDPTENFLLPAGLAVPRDGRLELKLTEPMEELTYLDYLGLTAYDLPPGWHMTLDERAGVNSPFPTGEPRYYRRSLQPRRVVNERQEEVTSLVRETDLQPAPTGKLDRRFLGLLEAEHVLTLEFFEPLDRLPGQPMLVANGWIEYPYSQTAFAAWQAGERYSAPTAEACGPDGQWQVVLQEFGYPAGMPREMSAPLDNLPPGATKLRLRTNQEIYWDRLFVAYAEPCPEITQHALPLIRAELRESGFTFRTYGTHRQPDFDYSTRVPLAETRDPAGYYTAFGSVDPLVATADNALAIFGPGEEIHLEFLPPRISCPAGWHRQLVLKAVGWCKDTDLYTQYGDTVEPLPSRGSTTRRDSLHSQYNTRYQSGR